MLLHCHRDFSRKRLIDCGFLACDYRPIVSIVTFREKVSLTVHSWHVITSSSLLFAAKKINSLCILGMRIPPHRQHRYVSRKGLIPTNRQHRYISRKGFIDCAFLACDYRKRLIPHGMRIIVSLRFAKRLIDCAFLACDYHLIVITFREKERVSISLKQE